MLNKLKPIMFVGTGSDVGKSLVNTAFCRIFKEDGYNPAPFKAQNMSLNSYATKENLEIGRAQAVQAEAAGIECTTDMNPILLKPNNNQSSQIVLHGKPAGSKSASEYFLDTNRDDLFIEVKKAFDRLQAKHNPIVMEGAGSISEMNLWEKDIVNMRMAEYANAATILVADIDRGGIFASVYGSIALLPEMQRKLIKGIIVNKFRGDPKLFEKGRQILEDLTKVPILGVLPYHRDIFIEQEDSVVLDHKKANQVYADKINIGVILLKSMSNFTDFNVLERSESVNLLYINNPEDIAQLDILIIPGSKNTIADLKFLREKGYASAIFRHYEEGKGLYGVCGGYQIMGKFVHDPKHIEGDIESMPGLGIFPIETVIEEGKTTRQCSFKCLHDNIEGKGYEIHAGITHSPSPFCVLDNNTPEGYFQSVSCWGTYVHGVFDNKALIENILVEAKKKRAVNLNLNSIESYESMKERNYALLAQRTREEINMKKIYEILTQDF